MMTNYYRSLVKALGIGTLALGSVSAFAQDSDMDLYELSLEELMNVEIVSATKKSESLFEAPVSSYSISRDEIAQSGVTSIPEALRLCPGVIVREMTNGNYDVHLRGLENTARYTNTVDQQNKLTLVMIDNRPVFNYEQGGTFWEFLPVDLIDVERIEIVRGPAAPLFGPNAVTGVINIITRHAEKKGLYTSANAQIAPGQTSVGNLALGYGFSDKLTITLSGNYQNRDRFDDEYYIISDDAYSSDLDELADADLLYPDPALAQEKFGVNAFVNYKANENAGIEFSAGLQDADGQKAYLSASAPTLVTGNGGSTKYANLAARFYGLNARLSHNSGDYYLVKEAQPGATLVEYKVNDAVLEYEWEINEKISFRPGLNFQHVDYLVNDSLNSEINNYAGSLQGDFKPAENWRVIAAGRIDKFNSLDKPYFSYQLATTYTIKDKYVIRAAQSRSSNSLFWATTALSSSGEELDLTSVTMTELGFRAQLTPNLSIDADLFRQQLEDMSLFLLTDFDLTTNPITVEVGYKNLPLKAIQYGMTLSANYVPTSRIQLKPFITIQKTEVKDRPLGFNALDTDPVFNPYNIYTTVDEDQESTPSVYGGLYANYRVSQKWNVNLSSYFFSAHTLFNEIDLQREGESAVGVGQIDGKALINAKVSYQVVDKLNLYINGRNLLGGESREFYGTDRTGRSVLFGASYNF
ncbi:TonB-dependent receptor plug domain-containing protein [Roseivirga sp. BDSF3-8]|uniref:TonB-dependent receptor plug domain-containing protein n=1 Tax=Roseivirga sp. BDSF3-8 TaxID=3241598 RepID=UPI0035324226